MSEVDPVIQKLWDGNQEIEKGHYEEAIELLEWVVLNTQNGGLQYTAAHSIVRAYAIYHDQTGDSEPLTPGTFHNKKLQLYMDLVIDLFPEMPPDVQRGGFLLITRSL